ncbi:MAG: phosphoadenylyl-sulfate reductase [Bacteroidales bacterium]
MVNQEKVQEINKLLEEASAQEIVNYILEQYKTDTVFATSLGAEDQVLTDMIASRHKDAYIITLDTGRLFPETYTLIDKTNKHYGIKMDVYFPDYKRVQKMVKERGINLFYDSIENRKLCCHIRKIEPLRRATEGMKVWITGLRRAQSVTRTNLQPIEWDAQNEMIKVNPLYNWSEKDVWNYIKGNGVPYNELHDKGYPSIGCEPCTRAVKPGEDVRAGRWWWEEPDKKECGLHANGNNKNSN